MLSWQSTVQASYAALAKHSLGELCCPGKAQFRRAMLSWQSTVQASYAVLAKHSSGELCCSGKVQFRRAMLSWQSTVQASYAVLTKHSSSELCCPLTALIHQHSRRKRDKNNDNIENINKTTTTKENSSQTYTFHVSMELGHQNKIYTCLLFVQFCVKFWIIYFKKSYYFSGFPVPLL